MESCTTMEGELRRFYKDNLILQQSIAEEKEKLKGAVSEVKAERQRNQAVEVKLRRVKLDIHDCAGLIQEPKALKEKVKEVFNKHITEVDIRAEEKVDMDYQCEFRIQREHLENSILSLRKQLNQEKLLHKTDNARILQENVTLLRETTDLRAELKECRASLVNMENAMELGRKNSKMSPAEVLASIAHNTISANMVRELDEKKKIISHQKNEMSNLRQEICQLKLAIQPPN